MDLCMTCHLVGDMDDIMAGPLLITYRFRPEPEHPVSRRTIRADLSLQLGQWVVVAQAVVFHSDDLREFLTQLTAMSEQRTSDAALLDGDRRAATYLRVVPEVHGKILVSGSWHHPPHVTPSHEDPEVKAPAAAPLTLQFQWVYMRAVELDRLVAQVRAMITNAGLA